MSSMWPADLFAIYHQAIHRAGLWFRAGGTRPHRSLLLQIKLQPRARAGLDVADFHLLHLPLAVHLLEDFGIKFLEQLACSRRKPRPGGCRRSRCQSTTPPANSRWWPDPDSCFPKPATPAALHVRCLAVTFCSGQWKNSRPKSATQKSEPAKGIMVSFPVKNVFDPLAVTHCRFSSQIILVRTIAVMN